MTHILAIEVCATEYKNEADVTNWLRQSKYAELLELKGIKFRRNNQSKYLTREKKRPVWRWDVKGIASYTATEWDRSCPYVIVALRSGTLVPQSQYPEKLQRTRDEEEAKKKRHQDRVAELRLKRVEAAKNKVPRPKRQRLSKNQGIKEQKEVTRVKKEDKETEKPKKKEAATLLEELGESVP
jgi:hypothetical protein